MQLLHNGVKQIQELDGWPFKINSAFKIPLGKVLLITDYEFRKYYKSLIILFQDFKEGESLPKNNKITTIPSSGLLNTHMIDISACL